MDVSFPILAQRVTVLGSTLNMVATSAGVSNDSASGGRAGMPTTLPLPPHAELLPGFCCDGPRETRSGSRPIWNVSLILRHLPLQSNHPEDPKWSKIQATV